MHGGGNGGRVNCVRDEGPPAQNCSAGSSKHHHDEGRLEAVAAVHKVREANDGPCWEDRQPPGVGGP